MFCLHRFSYSVHPWRLAWREGDGTYRELKATGLAWDRKRDALPTFEALAALALDWSDPQLRRWTPEDHARVWAIVGPLAEAEADRINALVARWQRRLSCGTSTARQGDTRHRPRTSACGGGEYGPFVS